MKGDIFDGEERKQTMTDFWMWLSFALFITCLLLSRRVRWLQMDMKRVERAKVRLGEDLARQEYLQLSQQIQPHFLFNALNLLLSLARLDRRQELLQALEHLALFLRAGYASRPTVALIEDELSQSAHYLGIQQMRFGSRLAIQIICPESLKKEYIIPYLLQTLIENAFKHGLEKQIGQVELIVKFSEKERTIELIVQDNGPEEPEQGNLRRGGEGLHNLRRRLDLLFGGQAGIQLRKEGQSTLAVAWWPKIDPQETAKMESRVL